MANYSFVSNAKFRPFSYQEMLQPLQAYTQEYNTIQEGMGELGTKADVFDKMANEQTDPQAYAMYKQYSNDLAQQAESLAKQGLTPASRQGLIDMKRRYSSDIVPIEQAYKRRQELIDEQRKLQAQDSTLLFDRPASTLSLDELISNPALSPQSYSGALLSKQVGTAAQNLAKEVRENPRKWRTILGNQYYETIMQKGFRPEEIMQAVQNNPEASPILQGIVEDAVGSSGIKNWNDENILNRAYDYARQGLWSAVGETQYQQLSNKAYDYAMRESLAKGKKDEGSSYKPYKSIGTTRVDSSKNIKQLKEDLEFVKGVLSNTVDLNQKATRTRGGTDPLSLTGTRGNLQRQPGVQEEYYPNRERAKALRDKYGYTNGNDLLNAIQKEIDQTAIRENSYILDVTDPSLISQGLKENINSFNRRTGKTGVYTLEDNKKGDQANLEEVTNKFTGDASIEYDPNVGIVYTGTNSKGDTKSFLLDPEIVTGTTVRTNDGIKNQYQAQIDAINQASNEGDTELAEYYIDLLMRDLYSRFNSKAKVMTKTDSNI